MLHLHRRLILSFRPTQFSSFAIHSSTSNSQTLEQYDDASPQPHLQIIPSKPTPPTIQPSDTADTLARILIQHHNPYHAMEASLQISGIGLNHSLVLQTLLRLRNATKVALAFFVWARDHAGHQHDADAYVLLVDIIGRVRQFDVAWQLIVEMDQNGTPPTPRIFEVMVRRLIAAGLTRQAVRAFDDMEGFIGREPNKEEFNTLLDTLCKYGHVKVAAELFNKSKFEHEPDEKTYTIMIYGWCKINRLDKAKRFLDEISERGLEPNVVTYNVLLNGICRRASLHPDTRFDRTIQAADNLLKEMRSRGIEPDVTSYSVILHVYSRAHKPELTMCTFRSMKENGIYPTIATYTSVVKCLASCGRLEDAEEVLDEMARDGVHPSPATYNCFFKEYRGRKDANSAVKLYRKMREPGSLTKPNLHTFNILIGMLSNLKKMELLWELWNDMIESGVGPDLDSYTLLVHGLCANQKWKQACTYFMEMIEKGILPQKITFETLYRGLIQSDKVRTWRRLKNRVDEESLKFGTEFQKYAFKPYKR